MDSKEYHRQYHKEWYQKNKKKRIDQIHKRRDFVRDWFVEYRSKCKCKQCGENHPATLDFHHRVGWKKDIEVTKAIKNGWSLKRVKEEISKCDVLCSNCHRKVHW